MVDCISRNQERTTNEHLDGCKNFYRRIGDADDDLIICKPFLNGEEGRRGDLFVYAIFRFRGLEMG